MIKYLLILFACFSGLTSQTELYAEENVQVTIDKKKPAIFYHTFDRTEESDSIIVLTDGSKWTIDRSRSGLGWWGTNPASSWQTGEKIKVAISFESNSNFFKFTNIERSEVLWGSLKEHTENFPRVIDVVNSITDPRAHILMTDDGMAFEGRADISKFFLKDRLFIFQYDSGKYGVWNIDLNKVFEGWTFLGWLEDEENEMKKVTIDTEIILNLEKKLNERVLGQEEAASAVTLSLLNYAAGLKNPHKPVAVFLFLGPSGVGKTELAKVLADELYQGKNHLIRFDMSHFKDQYDITRLIGSSPGYIGYGEGGQLTEAIKSNPQSVVLLDEMEKAHPAVYKFFLPVFDDGVLKDSQNNLCECKDTIFIMTSNLCALEIVELFNEGYNQDQIIEMIEPRLMKVLSPELYNRVVPIVFNPITRETMENLVHFMLKEVSARVKKSKNIEVYFDESVIHYLVVNGFHPSLGARPLKKLIDKKVVATLSLNMINQNYPENTVLNVSYSAASDEWVVE